jgi:hypothetical protein
MPIVLKNRAPGTDDLAMSDLVVNDSNDTAEPPAPHAFSLDGEAPRLGTGPSVAPPPPPPAPASEFATPQPMATTDGPTLPVVSPVLTAPAAQARPAVDAVSAASTADDTPGATAPPEHPMAHLMPAKSVPGEASRRAAEKRAIQKAKAKKIKIGVAAGVLVFTALVGPPLGRWLVNAINEAGSTTPVEDTAD